MIYTTYLAQILVFINLGYAIASIFNFQTEMFLRNVCLAFLSYVVFTYRSLFRTWIELPAQIVCFLWMIGSFYNLYDNISWYDEMTHFVGPAVVALFILPSLKSYLPRNIPHWFYYLSIICMTVTLGVIWEFYEYYFANLFLQTYTDMDLEDTISDMVFDLAGAISAVNVYRYRDALLTLFTSPKTTVQVAEIYETSSQI